MNDYVVTNGAGKQLTVKANSIEHAFKVALEVIGGHQLPITIDSTTGAGERLLMPDMSQGVML